MKRPIEYQAAQLELFWSYREWFVGNIDAGKEIMANIVMFIPLGFFPSLFTNKRHSIIPIAIMLSLTIEFLQLIFLRGLFEWDDVISNVFGALVGVCFFAVLEALFKDKALSTISFVVAVFFAVISILIYITGKNDIETDSTSRFYCFQIDEADYVDNRLTIAGFAFLYNQPECEYDLLLKAVKDGKIVKLDICKDIRIDVNNYFGCKQNSLGFVATGIIDPTAEYQIMIKWPWAIPISTGVFFSLSGVHYVIEEEFTAPKIRAEFIKNGVLRVYRPDYHCWIYQYQESLYWIVDQNYYFENDGSTSIQYQLWTTQANKLPQYRIDNNWLWDNISGNFEDYEIFDEFDTYRVMKRELPTDYPITSIVTGYYNDGKWIWKECFRPIYQF